MKTAEEKRQYDKEYREKNKEKFRKLRKQYYDSHRDEMTRRTRDYYQKHKEKIKADAIRTGKIVRRKQRLAVLDHYSNVSQAGQ